MQAFQPRPIQLPGGQPSSFGPSFEPGGGIDFSKMMRIGLIIGLVIFAIFIISVGKSYTAKQHNVAQNQDIRPLGQVHTDNVQVTMPTASELIQLPLFIQGTARLDWFSDGIFPIEIRDGKNTILASGFAIADIVDPNTETANFRAVIEGFDVRPETRIGRVILYRQVLRENPGADDIASIGIDFSRLGDKWQKPVAASTTTTTTETKTNGLDSLWTDLNPSPKTETKTTTQTKKTTSTKYQKVVGGPFTCANGIDDDKDGQLDNDDPSCHTDGYPANARTYDGDLDEAKRAPTERDADGNLPDPDYDESNNPGTTGGSQSNSGSAVPTTYHQSTTIWQGNAKIRVQD